MKLKNIVYGLRDPRNDVYCYIGKSTVGVSRPLSHLSKSHSPRIRGWVDELNQKKLAPIIDIIEEVQNLDDLSSREQYWILYFLEINPNLLNSFALPKEYEAFQEIRTLDTDKEFDAMISIMDKIPQILKRERILRGFSQDYISKLIQKDRTTILHVEKGKMNIAFETFYLYMNALKDQDRIGSSQTDPNHSLGKKL